jgi:DMSO/TMAO reductase YedYZ molybdopterin-dependent catalytic subunit
MMSPTDKDGVPPGVQEKRITAKMRAAAEGRHLTGGSASQDGEEARLPPGQRLVEKWPVLDLGVHPKIPTDKWRLEITGLVKNSVTLDWGGLNAMPQSDVTSDIHCVTSWSLYDSRWSGVATKDLIAQICPLDEARFVLFRSSDGYTTNMPLARFAAAGGLLAHSWNGSPLSVDHGGPVRLVIPALYFWKSAKWLRRITFIAEDEPGYWEVRGYHNDADPWREERYG